MIGKAARRRAFNPKIFRSALAVTARARPELFRHLPLGMGRLENSENMKNPRNGRAECRTKAA
jgi:hypothetical protein